MAKKYDTTYKQKHTKLTALLQFVFMSLYLFSTNSSIESANSFSTMYNFESSFLGNLCCNRRSFKYMVGSCQFHRIRNKRQSNWTSEMHLVSWNFVGKHLVNAAFTHGR